MLNIETIKATTNPAQLLDFASESTLEYLAHHFGCSMQACAHSVALKLFGTNSVTISGTQQTVGSTFKKRYDLSDGSQACQALRWWGVAARSLATWEATGDIKAYHAACKADPTLYRHMVQTLKLTRHNK